MDPQTADGAPADHEEPADAPDVPESEAQQQPVEGGPPRPLEPRSERRLAWLAIVFASISALGLAKIVGVVGKGGVAEVAHVLAVIVVLFGVAGFGPTRLLLPDSLRRHELLWVLPIGAVAISLELTALSYAGLPFDVGLGLAGLVSVALAIYGWRRDPGLRVARSAQLGAASWRTLLIALYVALLIALIALLPLFRGGFVTVIGNGSDAHLAVGTAKFLQSHHVKDVDVTEPVDHVPLVWRSKPPIYLTFGAVARAAGMEPYAVIATLAAALLALAALGFWLLARELLGAGAWAAAGVMALIGLNRMALFTGMHPYFNQTWGYMALPFSIVLAWHALRSRTVGGWLLLGAFLAMLGFAYPLALPIPLLSLVVFAGFDRRRRGLPLVSLPKLKNRRQLIWIIPLALLLLTGPVKGVFEKAGSVMSLLNHGGSLINWGGDLTAFIPERHFLGLGNTGVSAIAFLLLIAGLVLALRRAPRDIAFGLGAVVLFGAAAAAFFRPQDYGWYFHFKALAFTAPIAIAVAAVGLSRFDKRWMSIVAVLILITAARESAVREIGTTFDQLPKSMLELKEVDARLPAGASLRLDMAPDGRQLWAGYMLSGQPLCSQRPVLETSYPHVPVSRAADYVLVDSELKKPVDAAGLPLMQLERYTLFALKPGLGRDRCSQKMVQTVTAVQ